MTEADRRAVEAWLGRARLAGEAWLRSGVPAKLPLDGLSVSARRFLAAWLGEGEVSMSWNGAEGTCRAQANESLFAGFWRIREGEAEWYEVAPAPALIGVAVSDMALSTKAVAEASSIPAVLAEPVRSVLRYRPGRAPHVTNLSVLRLSAEDQAEVDAWLGEGDLRIEALGFGKCRATSTCIPNLWRVRFFNAQDALALDTLEVAAIPEEALASGEDIADSCRRLREQLVEEAA